jgi:UDP-N-acetyl-D-mannosaminuronate dehydrogenase
MLSHTFLSSMPRIAIIGYGVVGRALGGVVASKVRGAEVVAYDSRATGRSAGKVRLAKTLPVALKGADFIFLCVPSHLKGEGVSGSGWKALARQIANYAELAAIVVIKSTLVPGDVVRLEAIGIKPFLVQRGSFQGVAKCYD